VRDVDIRPCSLQDLERLVISWPVVGGVHEAHFRAQERGDTTYLVAWDEEIARGSGVVRWRNSPEYQLTGLLPGCPEICHLQVRPEYRSRGVGTQLIAKAEGLVRARALTRVGVVVADDNVGATALYVRLGFVPTGHTFLGEYDWTDGAGRLQHAVETNVVMLKSLDVS
jgi:ribosomal protein S18 acetylase RimI-like enzyme